MCGFTCIGTTDNDLVLYKEGTTKEDSRFIRISKDEYFKYKLMGYTFYNLTEDLEAERCCQIIKDDNVLKQVNITDKNKTRIELVLDLDTSLLSYNIVNNSSSVLYLDGTAFYSRFRRDVESFYIDAVKPKDIYEVENNISFVRIENWNHFCCYVHSSIERCHYLSINLKFSNKELRVLNFRQEMTKF